MVQAGVDHQAAGAEQEAFQIADLAEGIAVIDPQFGRQAFGIQAPALAIGRKAADPAIQRQVARFARQLALEQVAGRRLVIGQGLQRPARPFGRVAQVDVVDAGPRAIQAAALGVSAGRARLDRHRHAPHLEIAARNARKHLGHPRPDRRHLGVDIGQQLFTARIGVSETEARVLAQTLQPFRHGPLRQILRFQQAVDARLQLGHLFAADAVDVVRRVFGGREIAQVPGVIGVAVRHALDPRLMAGQGQQAFDLGDLPVQGRDHRPVEQGRRLGAAIRQPLVARPARQRQDHRLPRARRRPQRLQLIARLGQDEVRCDRPHGGVGAGAFGVLVQSDGEARRPRQEGLHIRRVVDRVGAVQEIGNVAVGAADLGHAIGGLFPAVGRMPFEPAIAVGDLALEQGHVMVQPSVGAQGRDVDAAQFGQPLGRLVALGGEEGRGPVVQQGALPGPRPDVQAQVRHPLRPVVQRILELAGQQGVQPGVLVVPARPGGGRQGRGARERDGRSQQAAAVDGHGASPSFGHRAWPRRR